MPTTLYWVEGPWPGKLALSSRPRGGDWLADEIVNWQRGGINTVVSLLTPEEEHDLGLQDEAQEVDSRKMHFVSFPIVDRDVPKSETALTLTLAELDADLSSGKNVVVHCRQGVGRSGLAAASLLIMKGLKPEEAVKRVSEARGTTVPETSEQRRWVDRFAASMTASNGNTHKLTHP